MKDVLTHVEYLIWAAKAVKLANMRWREIRPNGPDILMTREGLHHWLYRWGRLSGRIEPHDEPRKHPYSHYVALAYDKDAEAVKAAARDYWRLLLKEGQAR